MATRGPTWRVPAALVALGTVPVVAGTLRLVELSGGAETLPSAVTSPRFFPPEYNDSGIAMHRAATTAMAIRADRGRARNRRQAFVMVGGQTRA